MGNCLGHRSSTQWAGDDWGTLANDDVDDGFFVNESTRDTCEYKGMRNIEEKGLLGLTTSSSATTNHEVKVKITKKQLEELLGMVDVKELTVQQVLAQLINVGNQYDTNQRSWRPALQSIPEVN